MRPLCVLHTHTHPALCTHTHEQSSAEQEALLQKRQQAGWLPHAHTALGSNTSRRVSVPSLPCQVSPRCYLSPS